MTSHWEEKDYSEPRYFSTHAKEKAERSEREAHAGADWKASEASQTKNSVAVFNDRIKIPENGGL